MLKVKYSSKFLKSFRKFSRNVQKLGVKRIEIFQTSPFATSLKTHKLIGSLEGLYSFSINYSYRILIKFEGDTEATLLNVGTHSIYR